MRENKMMCLCKIKVFIWLLLYIIGIHCFSKIHTPCLHLAMQTITKSNTAFFTYFPFYRSPWFNGRSVVIKQPQIMRTKIKSEVVRNFILSLRKSLHRLCSDSRIDVFLQRLARIIARILEIAKADKI